MAEKEKTSNMEIKCPHYKGDGYTYLLSGIEYSFCDSCNNKLLEEMNKQKKLEEDL